MKRRYSTIPWMMAFAVAVALPGASARAWNTYYSDTDPGTVRPPSSGSDPTGTWTEATGGVPMPTTAGEKVWVGKNNCMLLEYKDWTITITGPDYNKYGVSATHGYKASPLTELSSMITGVSDDDANQTRRITVRFLPQPDWEVIEVMRTEPKKDGQRADHDVDSSSACSDFTTTGNETELTEAFFGAQDDPLRITEVVIFPEHSEVDAVGAHTFIAPPETGVWIPEIVYVDPEGNSQPLGGVRWSTTGAGLEAMDIYSLTLVTVDPPGAHENYSYYAFDDAASEYQFFRIGTVPPIPTLSEWGLVVMTLLGLTIGTIVLGQRWRVRAIG